MGQDAADAALDDADRAYRTGDVRGALTHCRRVFDLTAEPDLLTRAAILVHGVDGEFNAQIVGLCDQALGASRNETESAGPA